MTIEVDPRDSERLQLPIYLGTWALIHTPRGLPRSWSADEYFAAINMARVYANIQNVA